ncbi:hypothetical protein FOZ62_007873 [Perkinsus olseni]|uniref:Uncharacterized protein n=2 Tax=Perkinsus olseni TaxID=32597 RepID=A0A7J6QPQ2_PEROL|nr:hypothetical protein FOZ62_007873 [Perkinsus olseni]
MPGINFTNMKKVPMNYKFGGAWMVVIGTGAVTGQLIPPRNASDRTSESNFRGSDRSSAADTTTESPAPTPGESDDSMEGQHSDEVVSVQNQTSLTSDVEAILQGIVGTTVHALREPGEKHLTATAEEVAQHLAEQIVAKMGGQNLTSSPSPDDDLIAIPEMEVTEKPKEAGIKPFVRRGMSSHSYRESNGIAEEVAAESDDTAGDHWAPDHSEDSLYSNYAANAMEHDQVKDHLMSLSYWITSLTLVSIACMFTMYSIRVIYRRALSSSLR